MALSLSRHKAVVETIFSEDLTMEQTTRLKTVTRALCQIKAFLEPYLELTNTHGAEFLTDSHWDTFLSQEVQCRLLQLSRDDLVNLPCCKRMTDSTEDDKTHELGIPAEASVQTDYKIKNLDDFVSQARMCLLENVAVLTPLEGVLQGEEGELSQTHDTTVVSEAMSDKKVHEVGIMVEAVSALCRSTRSNMVVDVGSGKGYFASELSRKHKIPVVGFDSSDTNTHGASRRDKQLAKRWNGLERRNMKRQLNEKAKEKAETREESSTSMASSRSSDFVKDTSLSDQNGSLKSSCAVLGDVGSSTGDLSTPNAISVKEGKGGERQSSDQRGPEWDQDQLYVPVTLYVEPEMDLRRVVGEVAPHLIPTDSHCNDTSRLFLAGLHTCGSLAVTTIRLFLQDPHCAGLCCVGCCYQLMDEQVLDESLDPQKIHFPVSSAGRRLGLCLGRNARNLASQSVHRIRASGQLQGGDFLWRALLNVLLKQVGSPVPERIMGMRGLNKRCKTFKEYAAAAFSKLGLSQHMPDSVVVEELETQYSSAQGWMSAFFQLKLVLAPVIESLILLDRLAFLLEQPDVSSAYLVQLFDPVTSPRCFALVASKKPQAAEVPT